MRIIPGKTKVQLELFKGITLKDMLLGAVFGIIIILTMVSSIPYRWIGAIVEGMVGAFLLFRIDKEPNYVFVLNLLRHIGYPRRYQKMYSDEELFQIADEGFEEVAFKQIFDEGSKAEDNELESLDEEPKDEVEEIAVENLGEKAEEKTEENVEETTEQILEENVEESIEDKAEEEHIETKKERKERLKREKAEYKADTKLLKSKKLSKEEEDAIWLKRAEQSKNKKESKKNSKEGKASWYEMEDIVGYRDIKDNRVEYMGGYYGAIIEISPVEFRFFSEHRRKNSIENALGAVLRSARADFAFNIVKIERPIRYDKYIEPEYQKLEDLRAAYEQGMINEKELKARVEVIYDRINELDSFEKNTKIIVPFYYIALYDNDKQQLENEVRNTLMLLQNGEMVAKRLKDKEIALFLKYTNELDFNEDDINRVRPEDYAKWAMPNKVEVRGNNVIVNDIVTHNMRIVNYPSVVSDAWLASVLTFPSTKVVIKATPMDRGKSITSIDRSLSELRAKYIAAKTDSEVIELQGHIETLQSLLAMLQNDNEGLMNVNIYITSYDPLLTFEDPKYKNFDYVTYRERMSNMKKAVRRVYGEAGFRVNNMDFNQTAAFVASQVNGYDPMEADGRGMPTNTIAATYPWVFSHIMDEKGFKLGEASGVPVILDFFRRDSERVNSNMVIVGKSGSGKSYATKSLLTNLAAEDSKIFILDPENEYTELSKNLGGKFINVANSKYGRLNPFHIITTLDDDENDQETESSGYSTHLQFLEEFFKQILPECDTDSLEYLNSLVDRTYQNKGIDQYTDLSKLKPEDYPIFDDLYDEILKEFQRTDNEYIRTMLRTLMNYISKFSTGGRNATIWNGPSTVTTDENFTVFNFQSLLSNRNGTIANAQMLLVLKYVDNEIIKNRDYNTKYGLNRKVVVVIDEAHVFIDTKFPVALDFMFQLAKRIRKYNGMQIVITQNIKDFVGSEDIARKSSAIINACQYSLIFSLAPNDMSDLCKLYEKAGGINENEQEDIMQAPRGQAFTIMGPSSRSTFQITVPEAIVSLFEDADSGFRYFDGQGGQENWEAYIKDSDEKREENMLRMFDEKYEEEEETVQQVSYVSFSEISDEELSAMNEPAQEAVSAPIPEPEPVSEPTFESSLESLLDTSLEQIPEPAPQIKKPEVPYEATEDFWRQDNVQPKQAPIYVDATQQPQIVVQAPQTSSKTEELLADIISKFSYDSLIDTIKMTVKSEVQQATGGLGMPSAGQIPVQAPVQEAVEEDLMTSFDTEDFDIDSLFGDTSGESLFGDAGGESLQDSSDDTEFVDLFSELMGSDTDFGESESDTSSEGVALGNIFDLAAGDAQAEGDDIEFDIMDILRADAEKLEAVSPIDEMITYNNMVCDLTLDQLIAYTQRENI